MKPERTIEVLTKLKEKHKDAPDLYMPGITNKEIVKALDTGAQAVTTIMAMVLTLIDEDENEAETETGQDS